MRPLNPGIIKNILLHPLRDTFHEPVFANVKTVLQIASEVIEGAGAAAFPTTNADLTDGEVRWQGSYTWMPRTYAEQREVFQHQNRALGRARAFWQPSWVSDFNVVKDIAPASGNVILVQPNGFEWLYKPDRYGLMIETNRRTYHLCQIDGYDAESGCLFTKSSLGFTLEARAVHRCMLLRRCRYDTDSFDWKYRKDTYAEVGASVKEVINEGGFF